MSVQNGTTVKTRFLSEGRKYMTLTWAFWEVPVVAHRSYRKPSFWPAGASTESAVVMATSGFPSHPLAAARRSSAVHTARRGTSPACRRFGGGTNRGRDGISGRLTGERTRAGQSRVRSPRRPTVNRSVSLGCSRSPRPGLTGRLAGEAAARATGDLGRVPRPVFARSLTQQVGPPSCWFRGSLPVGPVVAAAVAVVPCRSGGGQESQRVALECRFR